MIVATVLDSSAFINSSLFELKKKYFVPNSVLFELKDLKSKSVADAALVAGTLAVRDPTPASVSKVLEKAKRVGSEKKLSRTDLDVVALALELNARVVSDDFTLQNLAAHLGLEFEGVIRGRIKKKRIFSRRRTREQVFFV